MKLDKRQKIILAILAALVAFLLWQLMGLRSSTTTKTPKMTSAAIKKMPVKIPSTLPTPSPTEVNTPVFTQPQLIPPQQVEYLQAVDQYQLAQIKRMLAEQISATAAADANTAKAKMEINKILGSGGTPSNFAPQNAAAAAAEAIQPAAPSTGYQVMYVGNKEGAWSAILSQNGQYSIVTPGMTLPDNSVVSSITSSGVTLKLNDNITFIPFQNSLTG